MAQVHPNPETEENPHAETQGAPPQSTSSPRLLRRIRPLSSSNCSLNTAQRPELRKKIALRRKLKVRVERLPSQFTSNSVLTMLPPSLKRTEPSSLSLPTTLIQSRWLSTSQLSAERRVSPTASSAERLPLANSAT